MLLDVSHMIGEAWHGIRFHGDGTVEVPDHGMFMCDMDYIKSLKVEVDRIVSLGEPLREQNLWLLSSSAEDFSLASEILGWRISHPVALGDLSEADFEVLYSLVAGSCVDFRSEGFDCETRYNPSRRESDEALIFNPYEGESLELDIKDLKVMLKKSIATNGDTEDDYRYHNGSLTPLRRETLEDGIVIENPASYFCLVLVAQSFLSKEQHADFNHSGVNSIFWTAGTVDSFDLDAATPSLPAMPSYTNDEMRMFELMVGRRTFLRLPDGVGERLWEIRQANVNGLDWRVRLQLYQEVKPHYGCPYWGDFVEGESDVNIYRRDYESYIDDILKEEGNPDRYSRLVSFLSFLDAENRFLMLNRGRIVGHPLSSVAMPQVRGAMAELHCCEREVARLFASEDATDSEVARVIRDFEGAFIGYDLARWILRYKDPLVAQVLDSIVMVNLRIASYIRDIMISKGISGERTEVKTFVETGGTLDPKLYEKLKDLCDKNGVFSGKKIDAAKALFERHVVTLAASGGNRWKNYLVKVLYFMDKNKCEDFIERGIYDKDELARYIYSDSDSHINLFFKNKWFATAMLLNEDGESVFKWRDDKGKLSDLTFKDIRRAIIDIKPQEIRSEWIIKLLKSYQVLYLKVREKQKNVIVGGRTLRTAR